MEDKTSEKFNVCPSISNKCTNFQLIVVNIASSCISNPNEVIEVHNYYKTLIPS